MLIVVIIATTDEMQLVRKKVCEITLISSRKKEKRKTGAPCKYLEHALKSANFF